MDMTKARETLSRYGISPEVVEQAAPNKQQECPYCGGTGVIVRDSGEGYGTATPCTCLLRRRQANQISRTGLDTMRMTYDTYQVTEEWQKRVLSLAQQYERSGGGQFFYISGQTGAGKTHICTAIAGAMMARGLEVVTCKWGPLMADLKAMGNDPAKGNEIERLIKCEVLFIDDFFKTGGEVSTPSAADLDMTFKIIDGRYSRHKTTIISSEYAVSEIKPHAGAIAGRILEAAGSGKYIIKLGQNEDLDRRFKTAAPSWARGWEA